MSRMEFAVSVLIGVTCLQLVRSPVSGTSTVPSTCVSPFHAQNYIVLCHGKQPLSPDSKCSYIWQGLVVEPLYAGPLATHGDCSFTNTDLLDVNCQRNLTQMKEEYDEVIFDIVDAVSGQYEIKETVVPRLPLKLGPTTPDSRTGAINPNSSAFIAFKKTCKPVIPDEKNDNKVINFCSDRNVSDTRVYLTLKGTNETSLPQEPSMCRCTISPLSPIVVRALDIRLQNYTTHACSSAEIEVKSEGKSSKITCKGKSVLYGSSDILSSSKEATLTLKSVSADAFPNAVWIEVLSTDDSLKPVTVTCEGFVPSPPEPNEDDGENEENDGIGDDRAATMMLIIGATVGSVIFIVSLAICLLVRHRRGDSLMPTVCSNLCSQGHRADRSGKHQKVPVIYSEPHNPRPSNSQFVFPDSPESPEDNDVEAVYSEPDEPVPGRKRSHHSPPPPGTPPPLPDSPPPSSPPPGVTVVPESAPPKPVRTFATLERPTGKPTEAYDHIEASGKPKLKPVSARDGQNNIIGDGDNAKTGNVYSHLQDGKENSYIGSVQKKKN